MTTENQSAVEAHGGDPGTSIDDGAHIFARVMQYQGKTRREVVSPNLTARECIALANYIAASDRASKVQPKGTVCGNCGEAAPGCGGEFASDGKACEFHGTQAPAPVQGKPAVWTLRETLDKAETTTTGYLWFTDPKNSAWVPLYTEQAEAPAVQDGALSKLLAHHAALLEHNSYAYFELAYTRSTGWMAWITDKPAKGEPGTAEYARSRKVIARGQGDTPEEAAADALAAMGESDVPVQSQS